ncbi:MAG: polyprenol monophosphomannose synthase [Dehalococcoidia bacterium]|nr:polyprenol monophosphomannose synthase [Dehalococcoidia bacterium]
MKTLVLLPTYNEKENIEPMAHAILQLEHRPEMEQIGIEGIHIVIVDDDSPDGTGELAEKLREEAPSNIHVIHRKERGRGTAGIAGFKYALAQDFDYIIEMDADFSHNPDDIPRFLDEARNCDVVIGSRFASGGWCGKRSFIRKLVSRGAGLYARLILGLNIRDWHGGYKCYSRRALASLNFGDFFSRGYSIGMETLYRLAKSSWSYKEIPIVFQERAQGKSKFSVKEVLTYAKVALQLRWGKRRNPN